MKFIILFATLIGLPCFLKAEWHVSVTGHDAHEGSAVAPLRTINAAAARAQPGDTVLVHGGVYREQINLPRGGVSEARRITYRAVPGEEVVVKGSEVIDTWQSLGDGVWQVVLENTFFGAFNPYALNIRGGWLLCGEWHHQGEVYLNGVSLFERQTIEAVAGAPLTWHPEVDDSQTTLTVNFGAADPNHELVEINVREAFVMPEAIGLSYITIEGFHFAHAAAGWAAPVLVGGTDADKAAYRQEGAITTRMGKRWIVRNNRISDVKGVGIVSGKEPYAVGEAPYAAIDTYGDHEILDNHIVRCGQSAIAGYRGLTRSLIRGNLIEDINHKQQYGGWETAAIKFHVAVDTIVEDNLIRRVRKSEAGGAYGIWVDMANQSVRLSRNIIYDTEDHPIYLEMNPGPILLDNNVVFGTVRSRGSWGVVSAHNLYVDGQFTYRNEPEREALLHAPHTRDVIGSVPGIVGEQKFYNDLYIRSKMDTDVSEQTGTYADYNVYLEGSIAQQVGETQSLMMPHFETNIRRRDTPSGVVITLSLPDALQVMDVPWVDPDLIGVFSLSGQSIEDRAGRPIRVDRDIAGERRARPVPGPMTSPQTTNEIRWQRSEDF
jgi:hypothetical protein